MTTLTQVGGACLLLFGVPLLGALPLQPILGNLLQRTHKTARQPVERLLELGLGAAAASLAQYFFAPHLEWSIVGLIALVCGRYWSGGGAATLAVLGGYGVTDPIGALFVAGFSLIGLTVLRQPAQAKLAFWSLLPLITLLRHPTENPLIVMTLLLAGLLVWIDGQLTQPSPSPVDPAPDRVETFRFFSASAGLASLDDDLAAPKFGTKAATLANLRRRGYPVPIGWVLLPGDDPEPLAAQLKPTRQTPIVVRVSPLAAGRSEPIEPAASAIIMTRPDALWSAIVQGFEAGRGALILQPYIWGVFSGEATPGPEPGTVQVRAFAGEAKEWQDMAAVMHEYQVSGLPAGGTVGSQWQPAVPLGLTVLGPGEVPDRLIAQVAWLAADLLSTGPAQTITWSHDGDQLWILGCR
jgi:hypothetical protein